MIVNPAIEFKKTGISFNPNIASGTHFCLLYSTRQDLIDILVPYFREGLDRNEYCLWVTSPPLDVHQAMAELKNAVPQFDEYLREGRIEIVPHTEWYLRDGAFDEARVMNAWNQKLTQALDRGYARMRVTGNEAWLKSRHWTEFSEYEKHLHESIGSKQMIVLCTYPVASMGSAEILDVARTHLFAIAKRDGRWDVLETSDLEQTRAELKRSIACDITNREKAEEERRKQQEILQKIIDNIPVLINFTGADGRIQLVNRAWETTIGWTLEEIQNEGIDIFAECYPDPQDRKKVLEFISEAKGEWFDFKCRVRGGEFIDISWSRFRLSDGSTVGFGIDVSERKRGEDALRRSEEKFKALFGIAPVGICVLDRERHIVDMNPRLEQIIRINKAGLLAGAYLQRKYTRPDGTSMRPGEWRSEQAMNENRPIDGVEIGIETENGEVIWTQVSAAPLSLSEASVVVITHDITERKNAQAALERAFQEIQKLKDQLSKENLALREEIDKTSMFEEIVGTSQALRAVLDRVSKVAPTDSTVLITGETGTGKELIARAIHKRSRRSSRAFVTMSCAAIPPSLIASELFGHEKGAFTGALQQRLGRFELAEGGTLFLDEIGELPAETKIAFVRVLQNHEFERVGGTDTIPPDVRIIPATNRDLQAAISAGTFRSDLFYRVSVFPIEMPPLRERRQDLPMLVEYFIHRYAAKAGKKILPS